MSFDAMALSQLSCHVFGAVEVEESEPLASLLELSEELGGSALGCAVSKVENCGYIRGRKRGGDAGE